MPNEINPMKTEKPSHKWYYARVKNSAGMHTVFYGNKRPRVGSTCKGVATPNKITGWWRRASDAAGALVVLDKCARSCSEIMVCFNGMYSVHGAISGKVTPTYGPPADTLPLAVCLFAKKLFETK